MNERMRLRIPRLAALTVVVTLMSVQSAAPAEADDRLVVPRNDTWKTECSACHLAYPPQLLPARSWRAIVQGLAKHFGTDASLDPGTAAEVQAFLEQHAGRDRDGRATPVSMRITDTAWFLRKHRKIPPATWAHPDVGSRANCAACHRAAERGDFDEDTVRLPR
jgi:diheme cytochrome c